MFVPVFVTKYQNITRWAVLVKFFIRDFCRKLSRNSDIQPLLS